ncbi:hypothetical protein [Bradyrhizobium sp.]|uniref:hypothetical protein n=1 Tax=Bradyrhizobium sp. TaxID=376 RepID=UPI002602C11A|nr:hypothetical protein [Bradyrhizobium sp.]
MKALRGWTISVGLLLAATAANAQGAPQNAGSTGYTAASDLSGPYADAPRPPPRAIYGAPDYGNGYGYGYGGPGPSLLPPREVYAVLRENGFSPLGAPRLRGFLYSISAIDRRGDDGHLVIDARDGRIVRFVPADRFSGYGGDRDGYYGAPPPRPAYGPLEPMTRLDARPPATPKMASRTPSSVPMPKAAPSRPAAEPPVAAKPTPPAPPQQSAAVQMKPAETPPAAAAPIAAKPAAPVIQATQPMPKVQDLE